MAYAFTLTENLMICRSRHTGIWLLQAKNTAYGYWATIRSWGDDLTIDEVTEAASYAGLDVDVAISIVEEKVRAGVQYSMRPRPDFGLRSGEVV